MIAKLFCFKVEDIKVLQQIVAQSDHCEQSIVYQCKKAQLSDFGWWTSSSGDIRNFCAKKPCKCQGDIQSGQHWFVKG